MQGHRYIGLVFVLLVATLSSACSTIIRPTRPSDPLQSVGDVSRFRFDGEYVQLREPGMPLANSRAWQREVANYTATTLNEMLDTPETAPPVQTIVVFDLASPSAIQIGTWKEMTIEMTTQLPSGRVVKSEPVTENIDDPIEYFLLNGMIFAGSALDVTAAIASLVFVFTQNPYACGCFIGSLVLGLSLNIGQSIAAYVIAGSEETRWSNLYQRALTQHARDIVEAQALGPPPAGQQLPLGSGFTPSPAPFPAPSSPTTPTPTPPPAGEPPPPPPLLDPADETEGEAAPGPTAF